MADLIFKLILAGDGGVGKTTLIEKYINDKFDIDTKMTVGVNIMNKDITFNDKLSISLAIWDFAGQERFRFLLDSFINGASGALVLFDLTSMSSFNNLQNWLDLLKTHDPKIPIILIGAKADLVDLIAVEDELVQEMMRDLYLTNYLKVSAKTGQNVEVAFEDITLEMIKAGDETYITYLKEKYDFFSELVM